MMRYTVLIDGKPEVEQAIYEYAHAYADRHAAEGLKVEVIQHGRNGDATCCVSKGTAMFNTLAGEWEAAESMGPWKEAVAAGRCGRCGLEACICGEFTR
jgi:hypothetical protein